MKVIITGGAGFIGCNAAQRYLSRGDQVVIIDNLSRPRTEHNLRWLEQIASSHKGAALHFLRVDLAQFEPLRQAVADHRDAGLLLHLAGQVAVTTSVKNPRLDFDANALGTFNLLEALRLADVKAPIVYASTNKVYGGMEDVGVVERDGRYAYRDLPNGIGEDHALDFHSPYGCSKGAADQYMRDYFRIFGLRSVVMRQSCIYGCRQFGLEDQGWVAWFIIAAQRATPISIYGDGKQVRDILYVDDLLDAYDAAAARIDTAAGRVFNVGGGPQNTISLLDLLGYLGERMGNPVPYAKLPWRPGDQRCFVADTSRARNELGWTPKTSWRQGLDKLFEWVRQNRALFD
jgi:CDP-paratose 2-epimerase